MKFDKIDVILVDSYIEIPVEFSRVLEKRTDSKYLILMNLLKSRIIYGNVKYDEFLKKICEEYNVISCFLKIADFEEKELKNKYVQYFENLYKENEIGFSGVSIVESDTFFIDQEKVINHIIKTYSL